MSDPEQDQWLEEKLLDEVQRIRSAVENIDLLIRLFGVLLLFAGLIAVLVFAVHMLGGGT